MQFLGAIVQAANVCDFARQFAREAKIRWSHFEPATDRGFRRRVIKGRIHLDGGKMTRIELEPLRRREVGWIKGSAPFFITPGARSDADSLLIGQIQDRGGKITISAGRENLLQSPAKNGASLPSRNLTQ